MRDDRGSAALEFITVGVILLVPLAYLVIALGAIQEQTFGVEAAARHAARTIAVVTEAEAGSAVESVLAGVVEEYGLDPETVDLALSCTPDRGACPAAGAVLTVTVTARARLPLVPPILGLDRAATVTVQADAVQKLSRLWGAG